MATLTVTAKLGATVGSGTATANKTTTYTLDTPENQFGGIITISSAGDTVINYSPRGYVGATYWQFENQSETAGEDIAIKRNGVSFMTLEPGMCAVIPITMPADPASPVSGELYLARAATGSPSLALVIYGPLA